MKSLLGTIGAIGLLVSSDPKGCGQKPSNYNDARKEPAIVVPYHKVEPTFKIRLDSSDWKTEIMDVNNDGLNDILFFKNEYPSVSVYVMLNNGDGTYSPQRSKQKVETDGKNP